MSSERTAISKSSSRAHKHDGSSGQELHAASGRDKATSHPIAEHVGQTSDEGDHCSDDDRHAGGRVAVAGRQMTVRMAAAVEHEVPEWDDVSSGSFLHEFDFRVKFSLRHASGLMGTSKR